MSMVFLRQWLVFLPPTEHKINPSWGECVLSHTWPPLQAVIGCLSSGHTGTLDTLERDREGWGGVGERERELTKESEAW